MRIAPPLALVSHARLQASYFVARSLMLAGASYFVIRLGATGSLAGKVSSTASSTNFSWR
jgi:hypothetical protein